MFNLFTKSCNHVYGKVEERYQYCTKCGKAVVIPVCTQHKYKIINSFEIVSISNRITGIMHISQCENCGIIKEAKFKIY